MAQAPDSLMVAFLSGRTTRTFAAWNIRIKLQREPKHCTWCNRIVPKYRRSWCGDECAAEWFIRTRPESARIAVEHRDKGVCATCKVDTKRIERIMSALARGAQNENYTYRVMGHHTNAPWPGYERRRERLDLARALIGVWLGRVMRFGMYHEFPHLWEADHIVPVSEGGALCGLEGLRTLCLPCHKKESARLAGRRGRKKKGLPRLRQRRARVSL